MMALEHLPGGLTAGLVRTGELTNRSLVLPLVVFYPTAPLQQPLPVLRLVARQRRGRPVGRRNPHASSTRSRRWVPAWCCSRAASRCCGRDVFAVARGCSATPGSACTC